MMWGVLHAYFVSMMRDRETVCERESVCAR
jgi:hypothetical protein